VKSLQRTTPPAEEIVTLEEAKDFLHITHDLEDSRLTALIPAMRILAENYTRRAFISQGWKLTMSAWGFCSGSLRMVTLDRSPLISVSTVKYWPSGGGAQVTSGAEDYHVVSGLVPGGISLVTDVTTPELASRPDAIEIEFLAGFADVDEFAEQMGPLRETVLLMIGERMSNRVASVQGTVVASFPLNIQWMLNLNRVSGYVS
jgi:uncharacterized phiE125 gp8 family phage protein